MVEREAEPVAVVVGHHVVQGPNVEFLTGNLDVGTKLYVSPPTSELEALRKRVAELEKALMIANANLDNMEFLSVEGFMDWQQEYRTRRVREGGKVDG